MRGVRLVTERIEKENVEVLQHFHRTLRNLAEVGEISRRAKSITVNLRLTVDNRHRRKRRAEQLQRLVIHRVKLDLRDGAKLVVVVEDVFENVLQYAPGALAVSYTHLTLPTK